MTKRICKGCGAVVEEDGTTHYDGPPKPEDKPCPEPPAGANPPKPEAASAATPPAASQAQPIVVWEYIVPEEKP